MRGFAVPIVHLSDMRKILNKQRQSSTGCPKNWSNSTNRDGEMQRGTDMAEKVWRLTEACCHTKLLSTSAVLSFGLFPPFLNSTGYMHNHNLNNANGNSVRDEGRQRTDYAADKTAQKGFDFIL